MTDQLFGPSDVGFTPEVNLLPHGAADTPDNYVVGQGQIRGGSNPELKPARSKAYTVGVIWSPKAHRGFSAELTYWKVKEKDVVGVIAAQTILQSVEDLGPNSPYIRNLPNGQPNPAYTGNRASAVSYDVRVEGFGDDGTPITAPGQVANNIDSVYMTRPLVNIATQDASGFDFTLKHKFEQGAYKFHLSSNFAYWKDYTFDGEKLAGRATVTAGTIPRWSNYTLLTVSRGGWQGFIGNRYIPKTFAPDETASGKTHAEAYDSVDVGIGYMFSDRGPRFLRGMKISFSAENLTQHEAAAAAGHVFGVQRGHRDVRSDRPEVPREGRLEVLIGVTRRPARRWRTRRPAQGSAALFWGW
ncbi:TonB-dependent receptor [Opitutus sp. ER46]|uniref:TonB-dependent receptor n=1 Tax=Opitutus sp. ER46 TaxID=2161864 RepID=UPI001304EA0D|nr:TonB-dependent receptor [Opitutus sp. ER46]